MRLLQLQSPGRCRTIDDQTKKKMLLLSMLNNKIYNRNVQHVLEQNGKRKHKCAAKQQLGAKLRQTQVLA